MKIKIRSLKTLISEVVGSSVAATATSPGESDTQFTKTITKTIKRVMTPAEAEQIAVHDDVPFEAIDWIKGHFEYAEEQGLTSWESLESQGEGEPQAYGIGDGGRIALGPEHSHQFQRVWEELGSLFDLRSEEHLQRIFDLFFQE